MGDPLQLADHLVQPVDARRPFGPLHALPGGKEPGQGTCRRGSTSRRSAASERWRRLAEDLGVAPFPLGARRGGTRLGRRRRRRPGEQHGLDPARRRGRSGWAASAVTNGPAGPGPPAHESTAGRPVDRGRGTASGTPGRRRHAEGVAVAAGVLGGDQALLAGDADRDSPARRSTSSDAAFDTAGPAHRAASSATVRSPSRQQAGRGRRRRLAPSRSSSTPAAAASSGANAAPGRSGRAAPRCRAGRPACWRSRVSAWARRSASGASPSYMKLAT